MKIENNIEWFNFYSNDREMLKESLMDNGYYEDDDLGIGEDSKGVFIIDIGDSGMEWRGMNRVKEGLSVDDVCKIGVECGVFVECGDDEVYGLEDNYRVNSESEEESWNMFKERVLVSGEWIKNWEGN